MKSADMVKQLRAVLPLYTDAFNDTAQIVSLSQTGNTATAVLDNPSQFLEGQQIVIRGSNSPVAIESIIRTGNVALATTVTAHDITFNTSQSVNLTVTLSGSAESEFNGVFDILNSVNRKQFTFQIDDSGPVEATGSPVLDDPPTAIGYNGTQTILADVIGDTIQFDLPVTGLLPSTAAVEDSSVNFNMRITNTTSVPRAQAMYTDHDKPRLWAFVVLKGTTASRDRNTFNDSETAAAKGSDRQQQVFQDISVYVFVPTTEELSGADAGDSMQDVAADLFKALLFWSAPTNLSAEDDVGVRFVAHSEQQEYNTAYYIHDFQFQMLTSIYREDTIEDANDVAFRDIDLSITTSVGTEELTASVDLDDYPINPNLFFDFILNAYDANTINTDFELVPVEGNIWQMLLSRPNISPDPKIIWALPTLPSSEMKLEFQISEMATGATATVEFNEGGTPIYTETFTATTDIITKVFTGLIPGTYTVNIDITTVNPIDDEVVFDRLQLLT